MTALMFLLNYVATHPDPRIRHCASDMILHAHSDGSHLSAPKSRSRAGGYFFLSNNPTQLDQANLNGAMHVLCKILNNVIGISCKMRNIIGVC